MSKFAIEQKENWRWLVTPKPLANKPLHRWCIFPHSFTSDLVHALIEEWGLSTDDYILDPFAGAGTTILAAKEKGIPAKGYDISPLAVLVARAKVSNFRVSRLEQTWKRFQKHLNPARWNGPSKDYPSLVREALPGRLLGAFDTLYHDIDKLQTSPSERDFFCVALLSILPRFSRAVATGGWLKWVNKRNGILSLSSAFNERVSLMLDDLRKIDMPRTNFWSIDQADARKLPDKNGTYTAVITSPPYPNRHDYTRVFGVELMFGFLDWNETRHLRYQSFHSHPEARPVRPQADDYKRPLKLAQILGRIEKKTKDHRIPKMIEGYFLDMYLCLKETKRVCKINARIAFVVGNAQYYGEALPVDELTAEVGEQTGLNCEKLLAARFRGNSAQQMGKYGRNPSRESVVVFRNPSR
jgi:tRNA G10  N-methylase Trm11